MSLINSFFLMLAVCLILAMTTKSKEERLKDREAVGRCIQDNVLMAVENWDAHEDSAGLVSEFIMKECYEKRAKDYR